jgi:hypothetical protein
LLGAASGMSLQHAWLFGSTDRGVHRSRRDWHNQVQAMGVSERIGMLQLETAGMQQGLLKVCSQCRAMSPMLRVC